MNNRVDVVIMKPFLSILLFTIIVTNALVASSPFSPSAPSPDDVSDDVTCYYNVRLPAGELTDTGAPVEVADVLSVTYRRFMLLVHVATCDQNLVIPVMQDLCRRYDIWDASKVTIQIKVVDGANSENTNESNWEVCADVLILPSFFKK